MHQEKEISPKRVEPLKTGELLVKEGLIRLDDIDTVLSIQEKRQDSLSLNKRRLFGMVLCDLNLITPLDNYTVLHKYNKLTTIQSSLVSKNILGPERISALEAESKQTGIPLISLVLKNKTLSFSRMQRLLFDLFHIPLRSVSDFVFNENDKRELIAVLDRDTAMKNRMIPLVLKQNTLLFGITDPENLLFVRQLNEGFPQYRFKTLFIPFSEFSWFYKLIYTGGKDPVVTREKPLDLSLLLSHKTTLNNPEEETDLIQDLYRRYELLRHLIGNEKRDNLGREFKEFIVQAHQQITREYGCRTIEFSLKKENREKHNRNRTVTVTAFPRN